MLSLVSCLKKNIADIKIPSLCLFPHWNVFFFLLCEELLFFWPPFGFSAGLGSCFFVVDDCCCFGQYVSSPDAPLGGAVWRTHLLWKIISEKTDLSMYIGFSLLLLKDGGRSFKNFFWKKPQASVKLGSGWEPEVVRFVLRSAQSTGSGTSQASFVSALA